MMRNIRAVLSLLVLSAMAFASVGSAEPACYPGFVVMNGVCTLRVRGEVQRPYQFSLNDRSSSGWRASEPRGANMRGDVVRATRAQPF